MSWGFEDNIPKKGRRGALSVVFQAGVTQRTD